MKLFFSYGHDKNEVIVLRLKRDLEACGHLVKIDKSFIGNCETHITRSQS